MPYFNYMEYEMISTDKKLYDIWDDFLEKFPIEKIPEMTLPEYTSAGSKNTFTWWMESGLDDLGSIWGGSSYKFGIYSRKDKVNTPQAKQFKFNDEYGWMAKYGDTPEAAFDKVRSYIVEICSAANAGDLNAIEKIDLGDAYKWKIAFHYQDRTNPIILDVFKKEALAYYAGAEPSKANFSILQKEVMSKRQDQELFSFSKTVWEKWKPFSAYTLLKADFLKRMPNFLNFSNPPKKYLEEERNYKSELCEIFKEELLPRLNSSVDEQSLLELGSDLGKLFIRKLKSDNAPQNLVGWRYTVFTTKWNDKEKIEFANAVKSLINESLDIQDRISNFIGILKLFSKNYPEFKYTPAVGRSIISFFLFISNPDKHIFIKTSEINTFLKKFRLKNMPNKDLDAETYNQVLDLATQIKNYLEKDDLSPKDFIDVQSFIWVATQKNQTNKPESSPIETEIITDEGSKKMEISSHSLNQILYGPPGTGKTYTATNLAVEICDSTIPDNRKDTMTRYQQLIDEKRISFVSFHQSYSYEEFIEGIKPGTVQKEDSLEEELIYKIEDGIFKKICRIAKDSISKKRQTGNSLNNLDDKQFFKMSVGGKYDPEVEEFCFKNGYLAFGWGDDIDYSAIPKEKDWPKAKAAILKLLEKHKSDQIGKRYAVQSMYAFKNWMDIGDIVIISSGLEQAQAIGVVESEYKYRTDLLAGTAYQHFRKVKWIVFDAEIPVEKIQNKIFSQQTIYHLNRSSLKIEYLTELLCNDNNPKEQEKKKNHVLIIDEINRGNISKILGELITLIEQDKRLGQENELQVRLPYSGDKFGVPSNLYIIGTMNTADRSIAFMDTALRRRFRFKEVLPDSKIIKNHLMDNGFTFDLDVCLLFETINKRIEILYDRDHQIGHSYFLDVKSPIDLKNTFLDNIIPLLQEYFYEDWEKLCAVMGCPHDPETGKANTENKYPIIKVEILPDDIFPGYNNDDYENRLRYSINPDFKINDTNLSLFFKSIITPNGTKIED